MSFVKGLLCVDCSTDSYCQVIKGILRNIRTKPQLPNPTEPLEAFRISQILASSGGYETAYWHRQCCDHVYQIAVEDDTLVLQPGHRYFQARSQNHVSPMSQYVLNISPSCRSQVSETRLQILSYSWGCQQPNFRWNAGLG